MESRCFWYYLVIVYQTLPNGMHKVSPNNSSGNIGFTFNEHANLIQEKFFWISALTTNINWMKLDNKDKPNDNVSFMPTTKVFNISSLYRCNKQETLNDTLTQTPPTATGFNDEDNELQSYYTIGLSYKF